MAAKEGHAMVQANLGLYYNQGMHGLAQSSKRAFELYTLAANQGYADAQYNLGRMYANGEGGIERPFSKARELWTTSTRKAAAQGIKEAIDGLKQLDKHGVYQQA